VNQPHARKFFVVADDISAHTPVRVNKFSRRIERFTWKPAPAIHPGLPRLAWLSKIERDIDACPVPISGADLKEKLMRPQSVTARELPRR